ncbi:kinase-like domain-containing protein [Globomyces pollinis-pini]|nr:kinase-like domain-containing protein [Globomyces pollinis-pini]
MTELTKFEDFRMTQKLGEGTFSEVLKVKHKTNGKIYAMKRFRKRFNSTFEEIQNLREIQALRRLNPHTHVIQLIEVIFDQKHGVLALNFELMDCNLYELISKKNTVMTEQKAKNYFFQICKGLDYMHSKGIFHRDIKPENILIKENTIKLADFGSCRGIHSKQPYTEYIATRWYRSPECLLCDGIYTFKMDQWGAGCVLYEIISKVPLFPGSNELDQLHRIHGVVGTPSIKLLKKMLGPKGIAPEYNFTPKEGTGIPALLPNVSPECIDMLNCLLTYDPDLRMTSRDSLKHAFFREYFEMERSRPTSLKQREDVRESTKETIIQSYVKKPPENPAPVYSVKTVTNEKQKVYKYEEDKPMKAHHHIELDNSDAHSVGSTSTSNTSNTNPNSFYPKPKVGQYQMGMPRRSKKKEYKTQQNGSFKPTNHQKVTIIIIHVNN